jgi:hypothetical protein
MRKLWKYSYTRVLSTSIKILDLLSNSKHRVNFDIHIYARNLRLFTFSKQVIFDLDALRLQCLCPHVEWCFFYTLVKITIVREATSGVDQYFSFVSPFSFYLFIFCVQYLGTLFHHFEAYMCSTFSLDKKLLIASCSFFPPSSGLIQNTVTNNNSFKSVH